MTSMGHVPNTSRVWWSVDLASAYQFTSLKEDYFGAKIVALRLKYEQILAVFRIKVRA